MDDEPSRFIGNGCFFAKRLFGVPGWRWLFWPVDFYWAICLRRWTQVKWPQHIPKRWRSFFKLSKRSRELTIPNGSRLESFGMHFFWLNVVFFKFRDVFSSWRSEKKLLRIENREISTLQGDFILWRSGNFEAEQKSARFGSPRTRDHFGIYFVGWLSFTDSKPWKIAPFLSAEANTKKRRIPAPQLRRQGLWTPPCRTRGTSTRSCREGLVALWVGVESQRNKWWKSKENPLKFQGNVQGGPLPVVNGVT